jgi:hypothetical protein
MEYFMGFDFSSLTAREKKEAVALVIHLQTMLAYQQLAMETYNDAAVVATGEEIPRGTEIFGRPDFTINNPTLIVNYVIPAINKKIEIFHLMETKHQEASFLALENFHQPYQEMTSAIIALSDRARLQHQVFTDWAYKGVSNFDVNKLDKNESEATKRAIFSLNELIKQIGLTSDEFLDIVQDSMNFVRISIELAPLSKDLFRSIYMRGLTGEIVRYFKD